MAAARCLVRTKRTRLFGRGREEAALVTESAVASAAAALVTIARKLTASFS
jgi:hypothetical protein